MKKIKGYNIPCVLKKSFSSRLPADFEILSVMITRGAPVLYGVSDPELNETKERIFRVYGNEEPISESAGIYVGSFVVKDKVPLHLFELSVERPGLGILLPNAA